MKEPRTWTTPSPLKLGSGAALLAATGAAKAYAPAPEFDQKRDFMREPGVYASISALETARRKRMAMDQARTHTRQYGYGMAQKQADEARAAASSELFNPAAWPLLWGSRELGRPEDLRLVNGEWR